MWYVELNGKLLSTPYQYYHDCLEECMRLDDEMVCCVNSSHIY